MSQPSDPAELEVELDELEARVSDLRQAARIPDAALRPILDATLIELELGLDMLVKLRARISAVPDDARRPGTANAERRLLRAVFEGAPTPIFLLDTDGSVRRANRQAGALLGVPAGYTTGKPLTAFVDLSGRAAMKSQLNAVVRTRKPRRVRCQLAGVGGKVATEMIFDLVELTGEPEPLIVAVAGSGGASSGAPAPVPTWRGSNSGRSSRAKSADRAVAGATQRLDLMTAATRLLLENATFSESVTLHRCALLLSAELKAWVVVDILSDEELRRQLVVGPPSERTAVLTAAIGEVDPMPGTLPCDVQESGSSRLLTHAEDVTVLGSTQSGVPVLSLLGATSALCVPLSDGQRSYGVLTLIRQADAQPLAVADLGLVEELGEKVALAIRVDRMFVRRSEVAEALQASLLPREIPPVSGMDIAGVYVAATEGLYVGGDFYDVYDSPDGWGLVIGDVQGKGEEAAAVTAMARHAARVLAHWNKDPAVVLGMVNDVLQAQPSSDRFVTAIAADLRWEGAVLHATVASAGHPGPALVRPDGRVRMLHGGGMPLGLFADCELVTTHMDLEPGDMLVFFTDGVTEARSPANAYFESRLADELAALAGQSAHEVVSAMQALVLEHSVNNLRDDMTMLALRVLESPR